MTAFDKKVNQIATRHRWNIEKQARAAVPCYIIAAPTYEDYQIVYMKRGFPLTTWASSAERAHQLAEQLRRVGYSVDVWQHTERGSRKTDL